MMELLRSLRALRFEKVLRDTYPIGKCLSCHFHLPLGLRWCGKECLNRLKEQYETDGHIDKSSCSGSGGT
jgi:hypothetical protein